MYKDSKFDKYNFEFSKVRHLKLWYKFYKFVVHFTKKYIKNNSIIENIWPVGTHGLRTSNPNWRDDANLSFGSGNRKFSSNNAFMGQNRCRNTDIFSLENTLKQFLCYQIVQNEIFT